MNEKERIAGRLKKRVFRGKRSKVGKRETSFSAGERRNRRGRGLRRYVNAHRIVACSITRLKKVGRETETLGT